MENYVKINNKPSEVLSKSGHFKNHLNPFFGKKKLDTIGPRDIERFKAKKMSENYNTKTVNNFLSTFLRLLNIACEWEIIDKVPKVKLFRNQPPEHDFLSFDEAQCLVKKCDLDPWYPMVVTALNTGLRLGELMALRWEDVDLLAGKLCVRKTQWRGQLGTPKSGKHREIPLNSLLIDVLKSHKHLRGDFVFCHKNGSQLNHSVCRRTLTRICKRAGLRHIQWHCLRHTFASHMVMRGVSMKAVQELMGHATMSMTMRYSHLSPDVRKDAVETLVTPPLIHTVSAEN